MMLSSMFNIYEPYLFLSKYTNNLKKTQVFLIIVIIPVIDLTFAVLFAYITNTLLKNNSLSTEHQSALINTFPLVAIIIFRVILIKKLQKIKYAHSISIAYELPRYIYTSFIKLNNKSREKLNLKKIANLFSIEIHNLAWRYFIPLSDIAVEVVVILFGVLYLLYNGYLINVLIVLVILVIALRVTSAEKNNNKLLGEDHYRNNLQSLLSIIEVFKHTTLSLINNRWYLDKVEYELKKLKLMQVNNIISSVMTRYYFETIVLVGLLLLAMMNESTISESVLAAILLNIRIGYSLSKYISLRKGLELALPITDEFLTLIKKIKDECAPINVIGFRDKVSRLILKKLIVGYENNFRTKEFNLNISRGEIVVVRGSSGSGKSTLLKTLCGAIEKISGEIIIINDENLPVKCQGNYVSLIEQDRVIFPVGLYENICLGNEINKVSIKNDLLNMGFSFERIDQLSECENVQNILSGGEAKRVQLIRSKNLIKYGGGIIIFDEIDTGLDVASKEKVSNLIKLMCKDDIVIVVTHDEYFASIMGNVQSLEI
jgi:ABC-type transport system involved in cytochrome bd biosynthesis fused ATPase/permease subunit